MARDGIHGSNDSDRTVWVWSNDDQQRPDGDRRFRVNASSKFYIAQVECGTLGCTLFVSESAERVRFRTHGQTVVRFEGQRVVLRPASELKAFVMRFFDAGCGVYVGGMRVEQNSDIKPEPFIYIISTDKFRVLRQLHPKIG